MQHRLKAFDWRLVWLDGMPSCLQTLVQINAFGTPLMRVDPETVGFCRVMPIEIQK